MISHLMSHCLNVTDDATWDLTAMLPLFSHDLTSVILDSE